MKRSIATLLVFALLASTTPTYADDPPPEDTTAAMACFTLIIGGIVAVGLWKLCKCMPNLPVAQPQPPPPPTNPPPIINPTNAPPATNKPPWYKRPFSWLSVNTNAVAQFAINDAGYRDHANAVYDAMIVAALESSTNALTWQNVCTITGYVSSGAAHFSFWSNGVPIVATYSTTMQGVTNYVPYEIGTGEEPTKIFRLVSVK